MKITTTDLRKRLGRYLDIAQHEKITITKNGKDIAVLEPIKKSAYHYLKGCLKEYKNEYIDSDINLRDLKLDKLKR